jgi:hypothetical protein
MHRHFQGPHEMLDVIREAYEAGDAEDAQRQAEIEAAWAQRDAEIAGQDGWAR